MRSSSEPQTALVNRLATAAGRRGPSALRSRLQWPPGDFAAITLALETSSETPPLGLGSVTNATPWLQQGGFSETGERPNNSRIRRLERPLRAPEKQWASTRRHLATPVELYSAAGPSSEVRRSGTPRAMCDGWNLLRSKVLKGSRSVAMPSSRGFDVSCDPCQARSEGGQPELLYPLRTRLWYRVERRRTLQACGPWTVKLPAKRLPRTTLNHRGLCGPAGHRSLPRASREGPQECSGPNPRKAGARGSASTCDQAR